MTPDGRLGVEGSSRRLPRWSPDEAREAGVGINSDADLAARWGVTRQAIAAARRALAIPAPTVALQRERDGRLRACIERGLSRAEAAREMGRPPSSISSRARRLGLAWPKRSPPGRPTTITEAQITEALQATGSVIAAGERLGISRSLVYYHLRKHRLVERGVVVLSTASPKGL